MDFINPNRASISPCGYFSMKQELVRHNIRSKKVSFCSLPTPFLLSKAEEKLRLSHPLPPKAGEDCTLSGALVTTVPLTLF